MFKKQHGGSVLYALHVVQLLAEAATKKNRKVYVRLVIEWKNS